MLDELQAERAKLDLRKVKAEHRRLDNEDAERARQARERKEAARRERIEQELARERARLEAEAQEKREQEAAREKRKQEEREALARIGQELQEAARRSVEKTSQTFAQVLADMTKMTKALTPPPPSPEEEARKREREEAERREARKRELVAYGEQYASEELDAEGVRPGPELGRIFYQRIRPALERLQGTETQARVEDLVDRVLDEELGED